MKKLRAAAAVVVIITALSLVTAVFAFVTNGDFETGDFSGWTKSTFINNGFNTGQGAGGSDLSAIVGGPAVTPLSLSDPNTNGNLQYPAYGHYSARINSEASSNDGGNPRNGNIVSQSIAATIDPNDNLSHVRFVYAAVMVNPVSPPHTSDEKPYFRVRVINTSNSNDVVYDFSSYVGEPGKHWQTGATFASGDPWLYLDWTYIDLASSIAHPIGVGDSLTIEVTAAGCSLGGHPGYVYLDEMTTGDIAGPTIHATGPSTIVTGSTITYTYNYFNGSSGSINPTIRATQPMSVTFTSVSDTTNCSLLNGTVTCNFTGVPANTGGSFTISGTVTAQSGSQLANSDYDISASGFPTLGGQTVLTSVSAPDVTINQASGQADPTSSGPILFRAVFSSPVSGFTGADVNLGASTAGGTLIATVTMVAPMDGTTYQVAVTGMTTPGNVVATIGANITNEGNNASTSTDNVVAYNNPAPTVVSIQRVDPSPTNLPSVRFRVTFSELVAGVDISDFALSTPGLTGTSITNITSSGPTVYIVTVNTGTGRGTIRLDVVDNDSIKDAVGNPLGGLGAGNGAFARGEVYTIGQYALYLPLIPYATGGHIVFNLDLPRSAAAAAPLSQSETSAPRGAN